jgi:hypothetical protein
VDPNPVWHGIVLPVSYNLQNDQTVRTNLIKVGTGQWPASE